MSKSKAASKRMGKAHSQQRGVRGHATQTVRGFNGPGWELSVTGSQPWVDDMLKKFIPKIQRVASAL